MIHRGVASTVVFLLCLAVVYWIVVDGYVRLEAANEKVAFRRAVESAECAAAVERVVSLARKSKPWGPR